MQRRGQPGAGRQPAAPHPLLLVVEPPAGVHDRHRRRGIVDMSRKFWWHSRRTIPPRRQPMSTVNLTPALDVCRADDRFKTEVGWLDSKHSFSFGPHFDAANTH